MSLIGNRYKLLDASVNFEYDKLYKARDVYDNNKVLIKVIQHNDNINPDFVSNLIDEFTDINELDSPHILKTIDVGIHCTEHEVLYYIVSEYSGGITLDKVILGNYVHLEAIIGMSTQILKALEVAYSHDFYHGDLKPSNILVDQWYNVKVCDFGVTKANKGVNLRSGGNIRYMCPHQLNINYSDKESDFFALGLMIFEAIFKKMPFGEADNENEMLRLIDKGINWRQITAINGNQELIDVIKKLLNRTNKYENTQDIIIDLSKIMYEKADIEEELVEEVEAPIEENINAKKIFSFKKLILGTATIMLILMAISSM